MTTVSAPLTWMDVARQLASHPSAAKPPRGVLRARAGWFGLMIECVQPVSERSLSTWLETIFPGRVGLNPLRLSLEGPPHLSELPIEVLLGDGEPTYRPTFGIVDGVVDFAQPRQSRARARPVPIVAILSVKGGTGRTTTAVALALRWAELRECPILLVDADLEAPGISYLFQEDAGEAKISLEDVITLAHAEEAEGWPETIAFAAERLRDHRLSGDVFVLPLRRSIDELASSAIRPEHLSTPDNPFALSELLSRIADRLGCAGAVVDVRAGLVPLGVNLAMDPEVSPVIVTTLADQSLKATAAFVRFLAREIRRGGGRPQKPLVVVNRVPVLFRQTGMNERLLEPLKEEIASAIIGVEGQDVSANEDLFSQDTLLQPFYQVEIPELPDIQVLGAGWAGFIEQIQGSGFKAIVGAAIDLWLNAELDAVPSAQRSACLMESPISTDERRKLLANYSERLIAAENVEGEIPRPLVTQPLAALAGRFQSEVPVAISEGAKGTGKTLAARYFVAKATWNSVVEALLGHARALPAHIIPSCASVQSSSQLQAEVDAARVRLQKDLGFNDPLSVFRSTAWLKEQIASGRSELEWVDLWLDVTAWSVGLRVNEPGAGNDLVERLRVSGQHAVALFEGLEELYTSNSAAGVEPAMRALLVGLPQRLRSEAKRPLGMIVFARRDTVEAAVRQNLDQYRREYSPFALSWTEDDVLELAAWLATQSGALPDLWSSDFSAFSQAEKAVRLEQLWGRKLGPDDAPGRRIREAYAATWIVAVLSDLRGRLVPRDLVRLLANAAKVSLQADERATYSARLLVPRALRAAVESTSLEKVKETEEEISELQPIFLKFRKKTNQVSVPLTQESLSELAITAEEIEALQRHGIVFGDAPPYEVPELFRRGLGLRHAGARRSVVNLYKRAKQS